VKFVREDFETREWTDRHTHRHTDAHRNTLHPSTGEVTRALKLAVVNDGSQLH